MGNRNGKDAGPSSAMPRWPLLLIGAPAAVAIWSGWVGLGGLCGFGPVHVLPGINDTVTVNTAICLPVGMEAYAAYALAVWLRPVPVPDGAREFAKWSAAGALGLGMLGQIAFHVLTSLGWSRAPVAVTVAVSCVPVIVVGLAAVLIHLMSGPQQSGPRTVSPPVFTDAQTAAAEALERTAAAGNPLSQNKLAAQFRLSRAEAREVIRKGDNHGQGQGRRQGPAAAPEGTEVPAGVVAEANRHRQVTAKRTRGGSPVSPGAAPGAQAPAGVSAHAPAPAGLNGHGGSG